jgi:hypothetical protein
MKHSIIFWPLVLFAAALFAQQKPDTAAVASDAALSGLVNNPTVISQTVEALPKEGSGNWIRMAADIHVITEQPVEALFAVLHDIPGQVKVFGNTKGAEVINAAEDGTVAKFTNGFLGIKTVYTALVVEKAQLPKTAVTEVSQYEDNGDIRKVWATWFITQVTLNGKPYSYVRFYDTSEVRSRILGQQTAISLGIKSAHADTLRELIAAAKSR